MVRRVEGAVQPSVLARDDGRRMAIRHTVLLAVAIAVLLTSARAGASWPLVIVLLFVFTVSATLWVRGQYVQSLRGQQWHMPWAIAVLIFLAGLALIKFLGIIVGVVIAYFGVGSLIGRWRQSLAGRVTPSNRWQRFLFSSRMHGGLLIVGLIAAIIATLTLGRGSNAVVLACAVLAILMIPLGASLLSESVIQSLSWPGSGGSSLGEADDGTSASGWRTRLRNWSRRLPALMIAGTALIVAMSAVAVALANSTLVLLPIAVLVIAVGVMASSTQADIVAIMIILALVGVTPRQVSSPPAQPPEGASRVLVALGDSYMSGEGASIFYSGTDEGGGNQCRRSPTSWAPVAGRQRPFNGFVFLACSGARTWNVYSDATSGGVTPTPQRGEPGTQLAQYRALLGEPATFMPELVVLALGGNDAGFSTIGMMCIAPGDCSEENQRWVGALPQLEGQLRLAYAEIRDVFADVPVVVLPYPDPIYAVDTRCSQAVLTPNERAFIHDFVVRLNDSIQKVALEHDFYFLGGTQDALRNAHLQLCDPLNDGRPGLNFIGLRSVNGLADQRFTPSNWLHGSLHPNERGHAAMLQVFETWRADAGDLSADGTYGGEVPASAGADPRFDGVVSFDPTVAAEEPCSLFAAGTNPENDCREAGARWAAQNVGIMLAHGLWFGGVIALGAWFAFVAVFASRRRVARRRTPAAGGGPVLRPDATSGAARPA